MNQRQGEQRNPRGEDEEKMQSGKLAVLIIHTPNPLKLLSSYEDEKAIIG